MIVLFLFSLLFFLYLSFPYGVLKEAISSQIQLATGITVRMESLGPAFPFGFAANSVEIYKGRSPRVKVKEISAKVSLLQLLMLRLGVAVEAEDMKGGDLAVSMGYGLLDLVTGNVGLPSKVSMSAKNFGLDSVASFAIQTAVDSGVGGAIAGPLLAKLGLRGNLTGKADLSLNAKSPSQSSGLVKLALTDSVLVLSDPSLNFPDQAFKTAQISANLGGGALNIDPSTRLTTADLDVGVDGKVAIRSSVSSSDLSLKAFLKLQGLLGEQYGMLVDGLSNGMAKNGSLSLQITGTVGSPQINPI
jgi:type II secretion system protein N